MIKLKKLLKFYLTDFLNIIQNFYIFCRSIMPKGYVPAFMISPTKLAANNIKARISRQGKTKRQILKSPPKKILPKPFQPAPVDASSENDTQDSIEYLSEDTQSGGETENRLPFSNKLRYV